MGFSRQEHWLEWVAISFSRGSSPPREWTQISCVPCIAGVFFTSEPPGKPVEKSDDSISLKTSLKGERKETMFGLMHMISSLLWLENIQGFPSLSFFYKQKTAWTKGKINCNGIPPLKNTLEARFSCPWLRGEKWGSWCLQGGKLVETSLKGWQGDLRWVEQGVDTPVARMSENKEDDAWALGVWNLQISDKRIVGGLEYPESAPGVSSYNKH